MLQTAGLSALNVPHRESVSRTFKRAAITSFQLYQRIKGMHYLSESQHQIRLSQTLHNAQLRVGVPVLGSVQGIINEIENLITQTRLAGRDTSFLVDAINVLGNVHDVGDLITETKFRFPDLPEFRMVEVKYKGHVTNTLTDGNGVAEITMDGDVKRSDLRLRVIMGDLQ